MSVLVCICQDDCRCESSSTHHSVSMPPAGSTGCCLVQLLLPGEPASSGFTLTLKKTVDFLRPARADVQKTRTGNLWGTAKNTPKSKNNSFHGSML